MVVPDFQLIGLFRTTQFSKLKISFLAELNLVSAGFTDAHLLSRKFMSLYSLCRDLLSEQVCLI